MGNKPTKFLGFKWYRAKDTLFFIYRDNPIKTELNQCYENSKQNKIHSTSLQLEKQAVISLQRMIDKRFLGTNIFFLILLDDPFLIF